MRLQHSRISEIQNFIPDGGKPSSVNHNFMQLSSVFTNCVEHHITYHISALLYDLGRVIAYTHILEWSPKIQLTSES